MGSLRRIDSKGFKDFHQKRLDEKNFNARFQISEEKKRQEKIEESRRYKSDWREETQFQENWITVAGSEPTNSTSQTFQYTGGNNLETGQPNTVTFSGLGGVESIPSTVTVDFGFGETEVVDGPTFSQFVMQGYAKPLGNITRRREYEDVNPRLDASQEFAQTVGADYMMNARVDDGTLIAQMDPQYLDKDGLLDPEKMDALFRDDPDEFERQIQKGLAPKPPTVLPDVAPVEGETILPQALQDALKRRRNNPPPAESTRDKMDKKQILDYLDTPEGKKFTVTNPEQYDEFINILTGGKGSLSPEQPGFRPPVQDYRDTYGDFLKNGGMINPGVYGSAFRSGLKSVGDAIADIRGSEAKSGFTLDKKTGEPQYTGMSHGEYIDRTNQINAKWAEKMWPLQKKLNDNPVCIEADKCVGTKAALMRMDKAATKELEDLYDERERQTSEFQKAQDDHIKSYAKKLDSIRKEKEALNAKIEELEKQRPINQQLDASQQAYPNLPFTGARVQSAVGSRQSSFSTSDTSQDSYSYDDYLRDEIGEDPHEGSSGPQFGDFGPFRSDLHYQFEVSKISERYRKKIDAVYDYYADGAGAYSSMRPVMNLEAERDSLIRELTVKKTAQDRAYNKAFDRYVKKLEAEKLARRARAAAAPAPPGSVPLPVGNPFNYDPSKTPFGADYGEVAQVIDGEKLLPQRIQDILKKGRNRAARAGINRELLNNYEKPEVQDVLQQSPELHDMYLRHMIGGAGGGYIPGGGMIDPSALANAFASGIRSIGGALADKLDVGTAKDVFDYFTDWNKNGTKDSRPQDLTNLLSPNDKAALQDLVDRSMDGRTDEFGAMGVNNELQHIINSNPGLRNSIGTLDPDAGDGAYVQGDNIVINKAYDFSNVFDILGAGNPAVGFGALGYGIGSGTFSIPELISGTDTMNMQIKIPIRRKKKKRKVKESTWSKLKKHR